MQKVYVVFDLEATCWEGFQKRNLNEIVEIGAYKFNEFGECLGQFHAFVKPLFHPGLSPYFLSLTGIKTDDIMKAQGFKSVYPQFMNWVVESTDDDYLLCAWGKQDLKFLQENITAHRLEDLDAGKYVDVKEHYNSRILKNHRKPYGLKKALHREGLEFEGRQHRALDDAYNLSRIFVKYIDEWQR